MKQRFLITARVCLRGIGTVSVLMMIIFLLTAEPLVFGQGIVLTRGQFSRISLNQRARAFEPTILRIALEEQVDPHLLWTIGYLETRFRPWLRSPVGAEGLMQFMPATARRFNLFDPYQAEPAIRAAARYVRFLQERFGGRIDSILAGYNAGEGAVDAYLTGKPVRSGKKIINERSIKTAGGVPPYSETISYVARGLIIYRLLQINRKFPGAVISSVYPSNISGRLARVRLDDNEIGFRGSLLSQMSNLQFWNVSAVANNQILPANTALETSAKAILPNKKSTPKTSREQMNYPAFTSETVSNDSTADNSNEEKTDKKLNEIYYEPRTGARYAATGGKFERLPESGDLVVGEQTRFNAQPNSIRARGTFFGGQKSNPK